MPGIKIGYLPQEPQLDPRRPCARSSRRASATCSRRKQALDEIYAAYAEPDADFDKLAAEQARAARRSIAAAGGELRHAAGDRRRRAAPAAVGREDRHALRRREAPRRAVPPAAVASPTCCCSTSRPTTSTPSRVEWLEQFLQRLPRHRGRGHARSLLPRQRRRVDPRARPRPRHSVEGQLQRRGSSRRKQRLKQEEKRGGRAHQGDARRSSSGCARIPKGAPGQEQGAPRALRGAAVVRVPEAQRDQGDLHPAWPSASATR